MKKIVKPLIFVVCLVVVFAIGYILGPGKGTVDNTDELQRLQKQLDQKNKQVDSLNQSLDVLKQEHAVLKQGVEQSSRDGSDSAPSNQDAYAANTEVGDLTFYSDLPKQDVKPEPLQADPKKLAAVADAPTVQPVAESSSPGATGDGKVAESTPQPAAAGTSSKPLDAADVVVPAPPSKVAVKTEKPLPSRYIPPGFERGHVVAPPKPSPGGSYVVQMGSFKTQNATVSLHKKLASNGFTPHVKQGDVKGSPVFRVIVGPYQSYDDAKAAKAVLKKKVAIDGLIVKVKK